MSQKLKSLPASKRDSPFFKEASPVLAAAPVAELENLWQEFHEEHKKSKIVPKVILMIQEVPNLLNLTVLQLEQQNIKKIFYVLKPCQQLQALYLAKNRIGARDITFMKVLPKLRKLDLSSNQLHFMPEA